MTAIHNARISLICAALDLIPSLSETILPATTHPTNMTLPIREPMARFEFPDLIAAIEEERSGAPLPSAKKVTPASLGGKPRS